MTDRQIFTENFFIPENNIHIVREKAKAKELRKSQWWKNIRGRAECYYCKSKTRPGDLTMDHIVPIIRGGKSTKSNVVPCCKDCNSKKKYLLPLEWQEHLDRISTSQA